MKIATTFLTGDNRARCRLHPSVLRRSVEFICAALLLALSTSLFAANPSSPQNVRSSVYSSTAAELFWNASTDADGIAGYRIYISGSLYRQVPGNSVYIDVLHPGKRYDFQISAIDRKGNESQWTSIHSLLTASSARSLASQANTAVVATPEPVIPEPASTPEPVVVEDVVEEIPLAPEPAPVVQPAPVEATPVQNTSEDLSIQPPVTLQVVGRTDGSVSFTWAPAGNSVPAAGYNLYLGTSYIATTHQPDFTVRGLGADSSYRLFVTAFDFEGNFSARSDELLLETLPAGSAPVTTAPAAVETVTQEPLPEPLGAEPQPVEVETAAPVDEDPIAGNNVEEVVVESEPSAVEPEADEVPVLDPLVINPDDFFGHAMESDPEAAVAGAAPTTPKNLRANLIGNNWVELNWAPSNDDGSVVEYRIYRDDGVVYSISNSDGSDDVETSQTLQNFWNTTTFTDCNFTHVDSCSHNQSTPEVGALHTYRVSAIDEQGNESAMSEPLTIKFHEEEGAEVARFTDPYLDGDDEFLFVTDLSNTANFIDQFDLVFSDEFDGTEIDPEKWTTRLTWNQADNVINGEMQYFIDTQNHPDFGYNPFILNGETLTIAAIPTPPELSEQALGQPFLSGALSTHEIRSGQLDSNGSPISDKFATTYGYVEGRIRVGQVSGMLTSFYLFRRWAGQHAPEIDIVEYLGENPFGDEKAFQTYHYRDVSHDEILSSPTMQFPRESGRLNDEIDLDGFHTYSVLWEPNLVIWYIDGQEVQRLSGRQIGRQSMNIIVYLVAGSAWAPRPADDAPFPLEIEVDYVRAYKRQPWQGNNGG